jgi:hypothetical protein
LQQAVLAKQEEFFTEQNRNPQSLVSSPFNPQHATMTNQDLQNTAKTIKPYNNVDANILDSAITKQYNHQP